MLTFDNDVARGLVKQNLGADASGIDFLTFPKLEEAVEDDVKFLRGSEFVPKEVKVSGWVYEVETGKVRKVVGVDE